MIHNKTRDECGKLTVFLGAAAGVGKTYAMLEAARERKLEGSDVVAGWVETHGRPETDVLLKSLPVLPARRLEYRGQSFAELDLDALLARKPELTLIDEMAHTNIPGSRHNKRYQDIEELLSSGIDVYTTLNIQHLESLNDIVAQITGAVVRETVPDRLLKAAQIQLVDIPPQELMQRLKDGKVFVPGQAEEALRKFFRPGNINALRELALRYTARRVDRQLESYMRVHGIAGPWPTGERIMVCVGASPFSTQLIRVASRMAEGLQAEWLAVSVETPQRAPKSEAEKDRVAQNMRLAEELGAETVIQTGEQVAEAIVELAKKRNISQIIIGKSLHSRFREWLHGSVVDRVIRLSSGISVHVIAGDSRGKPDYPDDMSHPEKWDYHEKRDYPEKHVSLKRRKAVLLAPYVWSLIMMAVLTVIISPLTNVLGLVNVSMIYLLPVLLCAAKWGTGPAMVAAAMGVITFDLFFVPPRLSFTVSDLRYLISFVIFLMVGLITGTLSTRLQKQVRLSRQREARTTALYTLSRGIAAAPNLDAVLDIVVRKIAETIEGQVELLLPDTGGNLEARACSNPGQPSFVDDRERAVAVWVFERGQKAGKGTETLGLSAGLYLPLKTGSEVQGVLALRLSDPEGNFQPEQLRMLEAFAGLTAMAINRVKLEEKAREAQTLVASEKLRTALFNSLSHDLRTPLASIMGAVTGLLEGESVYTASARRDLLQTIQQGAARMNRFINNLLDMAKLESGMLKLNKEWCDVQDIVGVALSRLGEMIGSRPVTTDIRDDLPLFMADCVLIEQVLVNLLDNSLKYSEAGSEIHISAKRLGRQIEISVADRGIAIPEEDLGRIFDKFYRLKSPLQVSGTGLGLSICKGIIEAHGGNIHAENNPGGGVIISFSLPLGDGPPGQISDENPGQIYDGDEGDIDGR